MNKCRSITQEAQESERFSALDGMAQNSESLQKAIPVPTITACLLPRKTFTWLNSSGQRMNLPYRKVNVCSGLSKFWKSFPFSVQKRASCLEHLLKSSDFLWRWMGKDLVLSLHKKIRILQNTDFLRTLQWLSRSRTSPTFMKTEISILHIQKVPAASHYAESD